MSRRKAPAPEALTLKQVFGHNILNGNGIATSRDNEAIYFIAGATVVRYIPSTNSQDKFYIAGKALSCVAISPDGRYLAAGERGHLPSITIWDVRKDEKIVSLLGHKHGVGCLAFSNNSKYLVSVGFKHDKQLILWDWNEEKKLSTQKLVNKVHAIDFNEDGSFFVTAGDRHLKWWTITEVLDGEAVGLEGKPASIIEEHRLSVFVDIVVGRDNYEGLVFTCTASGLLCLFNTDRAVDKWLQLESPAAFCLELFTAEGAAGLLVVGCASGVIRAFSPGSLEYLATLPLPPPIKTITEEAEAAIFPACYSLTRVVAGAGEASTVPRLCVSYADRSLSLLSIEDIFDVTTIHEMRSHHSCVWDLQFLPLSCEYLPVGSFVTCAADDSIRFWQPGNTNKAMIGMLTVNSNGYIEEEDEAEEGDVDRSAMTNVNASTATGLSMIDSSNNPSSHHHKAAVIFDYAAAHPDLEIPDKPQSPYFIRSLAIHPHGHHLACGDRAGRLRVFDLLTMQEVFSVQAHAAEVLTLVYSPVLLPDTTNATDEAGGEEGEAGLGLVLLASGGRDRLVHLFHYQPQSSHQQQYVCRDTLDQHSSSVTAVRFTSDGCRFLSCGGDKTIVLYSLSPNGQLKWAKTIATPLGSVSGAATDCGNKFLVTSGQDKKLHVWNLNSGKHMRAYKASLPSTEATAELYKTDLDPSGSFIATCGFDKSISLVDFFSGEVLAQVTAHAELVTSVKFAVNLSSPSDCHLVSIGGDGLVMIWALAPVLLKAVQDRLLELYSAAVKRNARAAAALLLASGLPATAIASDGASISSSSSPPARAVAAAPPMPVPAAVGGAVMPPQPPPPSPPKAKASRPGINKVGNEEDVKDSLTSLKQRAAAGNTSNKRPLRSWQHPPPSQQATAAEAGPAGEAFELFGRKIVVAGGVAAGQHEKHKFTLELTAATAMGSPARIKATAREEEEDIVMQADSDPSAASAVNTSSLDQDQPEEESTAEAAQQQLSSLEATLNGLEDWLEAKLKSDTNSAPPLSSFSSSPSKTKKPQEMEEQEVDEGILSQSLSSAYFQRRQQNPPMQYESNRQVQERDQDQVLRQSLSEVAAVRRQLQAMGLDEQAVTNAEAAAATAGVDETADLPDEELFATPTTNASRDQQQEDEEEGDEEEELQHGEHINDTSRREDSEEGEGGGQKQQGTFSSLASSLSSSSATTAFHRLQQRQQHYRSSLAALEAAKLAAAQSYRELLRLRGDVLNETAAATTTNNNEGTTGSVNASSLLLPGMEETDRLLEQLRSSLTTLPSLLPAMLQLEGTRDGSLISSGSPLPSSQDISSFLERYSDRLVDMVTEKIVAKATATGGSGSGANVGGSNNNKNSGS